MPETEPPAPARGSPPDPAAASGSSPAARLTGAHRLVSAETTGFFDALPHGTLLMRLWARFGLLMGQQLARVVQDDHVFLLVMAAVVGTTSGVAAGALLAWIEYAFRLFPRPEESSALVRWAAVIGVPVLGGLAAGGLQFVLRRLLRQAPVLGIPGVIEAIARKQGTIHGRQAVVVGVGTGITIGSGGSCGHEGPSVAIGAAVGSSLARFFGLRMRWHLAMVGAGCAGGLAAAFNAPLAGVVFTVEIVFGGAIGGNIGTMSVFVPLIVAAVAGTFTSHVIRGEHLTFATVEHGDAGLAEMGLFIALAALAGVIGTLMGRAVLGTTRWFQRLKAPELLKPALGALGVGLLAAIVSNDILGAGHATVSEALQGSLGWQMALALLGLKLVATAMTVGSGGFGGVFMPSLYIGACLGTVVGALAQFALGPAAESTGSYALVGMGAIFAATMHAPLTPIVMIFELTQDYEIILPLMLGCILAVFVARRMTPRSLFQEALHQQGVVLGHEAEVEVMKRGHVADLMRPPPRALSEGTAAAEVRRVALDEGRSPFVIDDTGAVVGWIDADLLAKRVLHGDVAPEAAARDLMSDVQLALLYPTDTLAGAMLASARCSAEVLPVVDPERRLVGVLRRGDLMAHYSDKVLGQQEEAVHMHTTGGGAHGHEVGLGKGMILDHIIVGRRWAGRTLADLALRSHTGATVVELLRGEAPLPLDPNAPLQQGDVLAVVGTREQILAARRMSPTRPGAPVG
ncbi:chloride channel protein [Nannocystis bainbridge]|uniref:Chloride channel protein n=1 Tax=Nannocystis bainbridge TaxID=2995303 RepID=A0ABT5DNR5_9BACT|nr:chloride channel protein [Nannocystis bainbridge]MDC0715305.1 chloride channel protein [Nannocystis bainbridge]